MGRVLHPGTYVERRDNQVALYGLDWLGVELSNGSVEHLVSLAQPQAQLACPAKSAHLGKPGSVLGRGGRGYQWVSWCGGVVCRCT